MKDEMLTLTQEWDKTFPKSNKVDHKKVTFINHFGITLAADIYVPKNAEGKLPAIYSGKKAFINFDLMCEMLANLKPAS